LSVNTWKKHSSGWNAFKDFENYCDSKFVWPLKIEAFRSFVIYCLTCRKISVATTKSYLASIKLAHELQNFNCVNFSKQIVWTACTLAFFTSVRMGEILVSNEKCFDAKTDFLWQDVKFFDSKDILLKFQGSFIDVFPFTSYPCCPVAALTRLKEMAIAEGIFALEKPVFTFASGNFLTTCKLNNILKIMLSDIFKPGVSNISAHSFRAAIPSAIGAYPDKMLVSELKDWGNWVGESYKLYVKMRKSQRKALFRKVSYILTSGM
jgi:hypothetical protein